MGNNLKRIGYVSVLVLFLASVVRAELREGDFVAICGDSITEQKVYSVFVQDYLLMCQPRKGVSAMQHGWSGQSTWDFATRMRDDTLRYAPTVATTCFGMNDGGYTALTPERRERYRENTQKIIDNFKQAGVRFIVIGSSGPVDTQTFRRPGASAEVYNKTLAELRDIARELAERNGVTFADVYTPMIQVMAKAKEKRGAQYDVAGRDGVHPARNGHLIMAYAMLKALGCDGNIGTIEVNLRGGTATATEGHKVVEFKDGTLQMESTRYPFCFPGNVNNPNSSDNVRTILEFLPFNEELNRFRLVVRDAGDRPLKVTWGENSKEFTAEQLAAGINLASEFLDNPFLDFFNEVDGIVRRQQGYETTMIKTYVHNLPQFMSMVPAGEQKKLQEVADAMSVERASLAKEAAAQVIPARHTIKIEPVEPATAAE